MIRLAVVVTDRGIWTGGYNYLLNLVRVVRAHAPTDINPVVFFADDANYDDVIPFSNLAGLEVVRSSVLRKGRRTRALMSAVFWGVDPPIRDLFDENKIDVVLEVAQFFGWRLRQRTVAWMADFQHRVMPHLFSRRAYLRREIGFQAEILANRSVILSSEVARRHCELFYPRTRGRTYVLRFAVESPPRIGLSERNDIRELYKLPPRFFFLPNQFWRHKNHECVVRALGILEARGREIIVAASGNPLDRGDPGHWSRLERLVATLGVAGSFRLIGMIPVRHLHALLQGCTALINPSLFEGWSTTVEEAKSCGTPMILSDISVHREQADGLACFFDPESPEALAEALDNYPLADPDNREWSAADAAVRSRNAVNRYAQDLLRVLGNAENGRSNSK